MRPQMTSDASSICDCVKPSVSRRIEWFQSASCASVMPSFSLQNSSPSTYWLNTKPISNAPSSCDSIFAIASSSKPFALSVALLMCGVPSSVFVPLANVSIAAICSLL